MILGYRYRLLPTKKQHRALESILESQRQLYNAALEERIDAYRKAGITRTYVDQTKALTTWRMSDSDGASLPVALQRGTLKRLDFAYKQFFRRLRAGKTPGFPRFRGKGWFDSFSFSEFLGVSFKRGRLRFKGMPGALRVHLHRQLPTNSRIRSCTFRRDSKGWLVCFSINIEATVPRVGYRAVGLDVGLSSLATLSNGEVIPSLRAARSRQRRLRMLHRSLCRKKPRSNSRLKAKRKLARCYAKVTQSRANYFHQVTARLVCDYDIIAIERLNVGNMARGMFAKAVHDASWSKFIEMLRYKAERAGARVVAVDCQGTTQECSGCGQIVWKDLDQRMHFCLHCGLHIDRDLNAAINILNRAGVGPGLRNVAEVMASVQAETSC